jgi:hypothetical protein
LHGPTTIGPRLLHYRGFTTTLRHTTFSRIHPDEWSARRRDLYLTTQNTHKRQTFMLQRDSNTQTQQARGGRTTP